MDTEISIGAVSTALPKGLTPDHHVDADPVSVAGEVMPGLPKGLIGSADPAIEAACNKLINLQRVRIFCIRSQSRIDRSTEAFIRLMLGFNTGMPEAERKRLSIEARRIKDTVEQGLPYQGDNGHVVDACSTVILTAAETRKPWDALREGYEAEMRTLAKMLPVYPFIQGVRGASALTLAIIVGEAGNLARYPDRSRLQKRLGLGVVDGMRQGCVPAGLSKEDRNKAWKERGYNPHRRAAMWAQLDDVLLRAQWRAAKNGDPGYAIGPYGAHYQRKKVEYIQRSHPAPDKAARRYMAKMFIKDLWRAWRAA